MKNRLSAVLLAAGLLASQAPSQRIDCAPLILTLPAPPNAVSWWNAGQLHVVCRPGEALVSVVGATGTVPLRLNLLSWDAHGPAATGSSVIAARLWPYWLPLERVTAEVIDLVDRSTNSSGVAATYPGDTQCAGWGLAVPALGYLNIPWPSDWESGSGGPRSRDIVISSDKLPTYHPEAGPLTPYSASWVHAVFAVVP